MKMRLGPESKIAFVCRGGPENGPFSAMAVRVITEALIKNGFKVSGIYASSGSTPTALLGCVGDFSKLCDTWASQTPRQIVGSVSKFKTIPRVLAKESLLTSHALRELIKKNWDLDRIFSPEAIAIKFPAVDFLSTEYIVFSNKNPKHKKWFLEGVLGSMALAPFLQPQFIFNPVESELISSDKVRLNALLLIDGGFKGNMLLEEAMRDGFDAIFLIDIHGLKPTETDLDSRYYWPNFVRGGLHILSNANDVRQFQITDRINEEIRIKNELLRLADQLPSEYAEILRSIIRSMDEGRLRLGDKSEAQIYVVSNEADSTLFNFAKFEQDEVLQLMSSGHEAGLKTIQEVGLG